MIMGIRVDFVDSISPYDLASKERYVIRQRLQTIIASLKEKDTVCIARASISTELDFIYACIEENIPFYIYVPFDNIEKRWPKVIKLAYKTVLKRAAAKIKTGRGPYSPKKISKTQLIIDNKAECLIVVNKTVERAVKIEAHIK